MKRFATKSKKELLLYLLCSFIWAAIGISSAFILQYITETAVTLQSDRFLIVVVVVIIYLILDAFFEFAMSHTKYKARTKISMLLRSALADNISSRSVEDKHMFDDGHYLSLFNNDIEEIESSYIDGVLAIIFQLFSLVLALIATFYIEPWITAIAVAICIVPVFAPKLLQNKLEKYNRAALNKRSKYMNTMKEFLQGFVHLKIFGRLTLYKKRHDHANTELMQSLQTNNKWQRISMALSYGVGNMVIMGSWVVGLLFALMGRVTLPEMVAISTLMLLVAGPFQIIGERLTSVIAGKAIARDLLAYIDSIEYDTVYKSEVNDITSVELKNATVIRGGRKILNKIEISASKGEKIAIIGESGSGKSSILKVLAGLVTMDEGIYLINGNLLDRKTGLTHKKIILSTQDTVLFSASVAENITIFADSAFADSNKDEMYDEIIDLLKSIGLSTWLSAKNNDVTQMISDNDKALSGGELKRINFAQILFENPQIMLLDEPTSGLDPANTEIIMDKIFAMNSQTILVATHQIQEKYLQKFDKIYVIDNGSIAEQGDYQKISNTKAWHQLNSLARGR